ncbi:MAG: EthD domain-containing protein [Halieaceae bacterium]|uniref:EthD domain-containing protein n=1 Tax=Haliea alexandrii TaxID=2448162 RepID=UPI000F0B80BD|nr:EthD domain-containing protein [Haliea alexandrii]MCR9185899.1 EthD domain-containing protein [Halieaceae bacterium]
MKSICLLSRLSGTSPEAFRDYYENNHSRLGSRYFPFAKYVRNHVLSASPAVDFDVITEFFFAPDLDVAGVHSGRVREILDADERRFMEQRLIRPAGAEEVLLAGPPRDVEAPGRLRQMLLLKPITGAGGTFADSVAAWGRQLADHEQVLRVTMDSASAQAPGGGNAFPYEALLSVWLKDDNTVQPGEPPAGIELSGILLTEVCESPPDLLRELYQPETG